MPLGQISAVTGRRIRPKYVEAINEQVQYVPALKSAQRADELARRGLDLEESAMNRGYELSLEELEEAKRQNRIANMLGVANLGLKTGLGLYGEPKAAPVVAKGSSSGNIGSGTATGTGEFGGYEGAMSGASTGASPWSLGTWKDAAMDWSHLGTAGLGTIAAKTFGKKKSGTTKALIGAGTSGVAQAILSGGDPFKTTISTILGGLGGKFL